MSSPDEVDLGATTESQNHTAYNPAHTVKIASPPPTLDEMRKSDPQGTIDYLLARKQLYKAAGTKQYHRAEAAVKAAAEAETKIKRLRTKLKEEKAMTKWWKSAGIGAFAALATCLLVLVASLSSNRATSRLPEAPTKVPVSGLVQQTQPHVLASVNLYNGTLQGSGTIISKGEKSAALLSAAHNFKGVIGGEFWVYYPDGTYTKAALLAVDRERDLALAAVDASTVLGHAYIPQKVVDGEISGVGYTGGEGPNYRKLVYNRAYYNSAKRYMWEFGVESGPFWNGDSGSGVFIDSALVGVTSQRDALTYVGNNTYQRRLYACSHDEILRFLAANKDKLADCGDYFAAPAVQVAGADAPPLWVPRPNVPITVGRTDRLIADLQRDVDELKRKAGGPELRRPSEVGDKKDDGLKRPSEIK